MADKLPLFRVTIELLQPGEGAHRFRDTPVTVRCLDVGLVPVQGTYLRADSMSRISFDVRSSAIVAEVGYVKA